MQLLKSTSAFFYWFDLISFIEKKILYWLLLYIYYYLFYKILYIIASLNYYIDECTVPISIVIKKKI